MPAIGLSGGIASGKSTVARLLQARGATILDADHTGHAALLRGAAGFLPVVARFGDAILGPDGEIDRTRLGAIVFADDGARRDLEAILHPLIYAEILRAIRDHEGFGGVVVVDAPLLVETGGREALGLEALVVVVADPVDQVERAVRRGTTRERAEAVIAVQAPLADKLAAADYVVDNRSGLAELEAAVDALWAELAGRGR